MKPKSKYFDIKNTPVGMAIESKIVGKILKGHGLRVHSKKAKVDFVGLASGETGGISVLIHTTTEELLEFAQKMHHEVEEAARELRKEGYRPKSLFRHLNPEVTFVMSLRPEKRKAKKRV